MTIPTEEIKKRLDLVELISEYVKLNQAGANFKALSPFTNEKTPSFIVSPEKQIWHCFSSGKGGDHFTFIQEMEGVEFPEALRILAGRAGVKLEHHNPENHNQKTRLLDICSRASDYWHNQLVNGSSAESVRQYLKDRKISNKTIEDFSLGYALDSWDEVIKYLQGKGFSLKEIIDAGLATSGDSGKVFDRFRHRLMFPIKNAHGNVVGFTSRRLREDDPGGKYVNTPQTQIYNKSEILYNLNLAKTEIKRLGYAILVEGNMDAITSYQAGVKNVIAVSGTALTNEQINILKRYTLNIMMAFDADQAGVQANIRGIDLAWQAGLNVKVINLPEGNDPDDLIRKNPDDWKKMVKEAVNFMDYIFQSSLKNLDLSRVDHKKEAAKRLLPFIAKLGDEVERSHYLNKLSVTLQVTEQALYQTLANIKLPPSERKKPETQTSGLKAIDQDRSLSEHLLSLVINYPEQFEVVIQHLEPEMIRYQPARELYNSLIIYYNNKRNLDENGLLTELGEDLISYFRRLSLLAGSESSDDLIGQEIIKALKRLKDQFYRIRIKQLQEEISRAEQAGNQEKLKELSQEFTGLMAKLHD